MKKPEFYLRVCVGLMLTALVLSIPGSALAMQTPAAGSFGYDFYDIIVNKMSTGAIGFGVSMAGIAMASFLAWKQQFPAMLGVLAGTGGIIQSPNIVTTFGVLI